MEKKKVDSFYIKLACLIIFTISTIVYLNLFDDYLHPFVEKTAIGIFTPLIVFLVIMKLVGSLKIEKMETKNIFQLFLHLLYDFRYGFAMILVFVVIFNPFNRALSFSSVMADYHMGDKEKITATLYSNEGNSIYDHENRVYHYYNVNKKVDLGSTYRITYLKKSRIITNIQGPMNSKSLALENKVKVSDTIYKNNSVFIKWKPFYYKGVAAKQYRIEGYSKQKDGTLLRIGSQYVVENGKTEFTIDKLINDKTYQFMISPMIKGDFNEVYRGTTKFINVN